MNPPDVMRQAREAFNHAFALGAPDAGFARAIDIISAAWPVADGRLREAAVKAEAALSRVAPGFPMWADRRSSVAQDPHGVNRALAALRAALSPPSAPAANVRIVRVAVAEDTRGIIEATGCPLGEIGDVAAWGFLADNGYPFRLCIAEIPVPIRDVPTVRASVEAQP